MDFDLRDFDAVWQRVTAGAGEEPQLAREEAEELRALIAAERRSSEFYAALARRRPGCGQVLRSLAEEEQGHERALQAMLFMLTGDTYMTEAEPPAPQPLLRALREAHAAETAAAANYEREAEATRDAQCRELYLRLGGDERRHAEILRKLAEKLI